MSSNKSKDKNGMPPCPFSPGTTRGLVTSPTNEDVDDALDFGMVFDAVTSNTGDSHLPNLDTMGDMGAFALGCAGSMGTRSPSPSGFSANDDASASSSLSSKRSRADFDEDDSLSDGRNSPSKRRSSLLTLGLGGSKQKDESEGGEGTGGGMGSSQTPYQIRLDREREGRCPDCGLETHTMVKGKNQRIVKEPLTIEFEVLNGRCLFCNPLQDGEAAEGNNGSGDRKAKAAGEKKGGKDGKASKKSGKKKADAASKKKNTKQGDGNDVANESSGLFSEAHVSHNAGLRPHSSEPNFINDPSDMVNNNNMMMGMNNMGMRMGSMDNMIQGTPEQQQRQHLLGNMENMIQSTPQHQQRQHMMGSTQTSTPQVSNKQLPFSPHSVASNRPMMSGVQASPHPQGMAMGMRRTASNNNLIPNLAHSRMALMKQRQLPRKHTAMQHARMGFSSNANGRRGSTNMQRTHGASSPNMSGGVGNMGMGHGNSEMKNSNRSGGGGNGMWQQDSRLLSNLSSASSVSGGDGNSVSNTTQDGDDCSRTSQKSDGVGRLGTAMAMGMGMNCAESTPKKNHQHGKQWPHSVWPPDPPSSSQGAEQRASLASASSESDMMQRRKSMSDNANNNMSARIGETPLAMRMAHSKLLSSIYHHHKYPMSEDSEQACMDKTLTYLDSGGGDICDIIVAMRRFPFSLPIQSVACEKLYVHCFDRDHAHAIGLVGGIRTVIDAMEHHPSDVALQRGCVGILKHLSCASPYNLEMLDRMGAVSIIVSAMERHPQNAPLLESCCWTLESIARRCSAEIKIRVAKGGGIQAAMKAVETFPNNESLLRAAFHCLRQLGYNPSSYNANQQQRPQQQNNPFASSGGAGRGGGMPGMMMGNGGMSNNGGMPGNGGMSGMPSNGGMPGNDGMMMPSNNMMDNGGMMMPSNNMMGDNNRRNL